MGKDSSLIKVNLDEPRYDQSTFLGRLRHFADVTDMRTLFVSEKKLEESLNLLKEYNENGRPGVTPEQAEKLWEAKKIKDAAIHPDTNEKIFLPFRFSAFVPMNIVVIVGMLNPNPSVASTIFWQWVNQSYNVALNHANRNASNEMSMESVAKSYVAAVGISCTVAVGLGQFVKRATGFSPSTRSMIQKFVPYTAVATAGIANVFLMRGNEAKEGIMVKDTQGNELGKSPKAGLHALTQVSLSRCVLPFPILTIPPLVMSKLESTQLFRNNPRLAPIANVAVVTGCLWAALPMAIAIFPQYVEMPAKKLEPQFHNLKDKSGKPIETVVFNRGL